PRFLVEAGRFDEEAELFEVLGDALHAPLFYAGSLGKGGVAREGIFGVPLVGHDIDYEHDVLGFEDYSGSVSEEDVRDARKARVEYLSPNLDYLCFVQFFIRHQPLRADPGRFLSRASKSLTFKSEKRYH